MDEKGWGLGMILEDYIHVFKHLRRGVTKFGPAPHKLILLLSVIREMEAGHVVQNRIAVTDALIESFMTIWRKNVHSGHIAAIALPFFHLQREGFWRLHAYPQYQNWLKAQSSISSIGRLRETVQYASLSADLFELFVNPVSREILKQTLLDDLQRDGYGPILKQCPFCVISTDHEILAENKTALAFYDRYPVTRGHTLIISKRHVASYFDLQQDELDNINQLSFACRKILKEKYSPQGFNLGVNVGEAAGQSIFHCHIHLIPRYTGDVANPRGGVRGVIPERQNY